MNANSSPEVVTESVNLILVTKAQIPLGSSRHVWTRLDTFDVSSESRRVCRACRAVLFDKLDTAKMHRLDISNVSCRDVTSQVEFGLNSQLHTVWQPMVIV